MSDPIMPDPPGPSALPIIPNPPGPPALPVSPLRLLPEGSVTSPLGFVAGAVAAGIKPGGRLDLGLLYSEEPCTAAGLFTRNRVKAAPVLVSQRHLAPGQARAVVVNSGCANACTGPQGMEDAEAMAAWAAARLGLRPEAVLVASTGVIGRALPMERVRGALERIALSREGGDDLALAIMTTDTVPKKGAVRFHWRGREYTIGGIAKGAGMIHPDMATMLAFLTTDAPVERGLLEDALRQAVDASFHMVTVDGDTSTNDTVIVRAIAGDGEGATKCIEVQVRGALSTVEARRAARFVAGSLLVKTAVHGGDLNWGRVLAALGACGAAFEEGQAILHLGPVCVYRLGAPTAYDEAEARGALMGRDVLLGIDLGLGDGVATAWGCDISEEYVRLNSEYTTQGHNPRAGGVRLGRSK